MEARLTLEAFAYAAGEKDFELHDLGLVEFQMALMREFQLSRLFLFLL